MFLGLLGLKEATARKTKSCVILSIRYLGELTLK